MTQLALSRQRETAGPLFLSLSLSVCAFFPKNVFIVCWILTSKCRTNDNPKKGAIKLFNAHNETSYDIHSLSICIFFFFDFHLIPFPLNLHVLLSLILFFVINETFFLLHCSSAPEYEENRKKRSLNESTQERIELVLWCYQMAISLAYRALCIDYVLFALLIVVLCRCVIENSVNSGKKKLSCVQKCHHIWLHDFNDAADKINVRQRKTIYVFFFIEEWNNGWKKKNSRIQSEKEPNTVGVILCICGCCSLNAKQPMRMAAKGNCRERQFQLRFWFENSRREIGISK